MQASQTVFGISLIHARAVALGGVIGMGIATATLAMTVQDPAGLKTDLAASWWRPTPISMGLAVFGPDVRRPQREALAIPNRHSPARQLTLSIGALTGVEISYGRGGATLCSTSPFLWNWDAREVGVVFFRLWTLRQTLAISVQANATGMLHLTLNLPDAGVSGAMLVSGRKPARKPALIFTSAPTAATVPLPGANWLLATGGLALVLASHRRKRRNAASEK